MDYTKLQASREPPICIWQSKWSFQKVCLILLHSSFLWWFLKLFSWLKTPPSTGFTNLMTWACIYLILETISHHCPFYCWLHHIVIALLLVPCKRHTPWHITFAHVVPLSGMYSHFSGPHATLLIFLHLTFVISWGKCPSLTIPSPLVWFNFFVTWVYGPMTYHSSRVLLSIWNCAIISEII